MGLLSWSGKSSVCKLRTAVTLYTQSDIVDINVFSNGSKVSNEVNPLFLAGILNALILLVFKQQKKKYSVFGVF